MAKFNCKISNGFIAILILVFMVICSQTAFAQQNGMMVRISEIEIDPVFLEEYKTILKEEAAVSVKIEPGVIAIFPMYQKEHPVQVRILEIYANKTSYKQHLKTAHFQKYKTTTLKMVKSLKLVDMEMIDAATLPLMFEKFKEPKIQPPMNTNQALDNKQQCIVAISALTAKGDLVELQKALNNGLDAGLSINQIKEVLVHLYAYCGFPRSLRGLQTFISVVNERKARGIDDKTGPEASPINQEPAKYERGKKVLEVLTKSPQDGPPADYAAFAPIIDTFLKEHLFADIFERDILTYAEREMVTVSVLSAIGGVEPMLRSHFSICLNVGITPAQLNELGEIIQSILGEKEASEARAVLNEVLKNRQ